MLQALEAEISPDGQVTLLEPLHLPHKVRAVVTILPPLGEESQKLNRGTDLLQLLDSPSFSESPTGDPERMEREIAANRDAWSDW